MSFKILIVEDDLPILMLFQTIIEQLDYQVTGLADGGAAIKHLEDTTPDLVLLDLTLHGDATGLDILNHIKNTPRLDKTVVIVISANPQVSPEVYHERVTRVITKPIRPSAIQTTIQALLTPSQVPHYQP